MRATPSSGCRSAPLRACCTSGTGYATKKTSRLTAGRAAHHSLWSIRWPMLVSLDVTPLPGARRWLRARCSRCRPGPRRPSAAARWSIGSTQAPRHLNGAVQSGIATAMPSTQLFASPLALRRQVEPAALPGRDLEARRRRQVADAEPAQERGLPRRQAGDLGRRRLHRSWRSRPTIRSTTMMGAGREGRHARCLHRDHPHERAASGDRAGDEPGALPDPAQAHLRRRPGPEDPSAQQRPTWSARGRSSWSSSRPASASCWSASTSSSCRASPTSTR